MTVVFNWRTWLVGVVFTMVTVFPASAMDLFGSAQGVKSPPLARDLKAIAAALNKECPRRGGPAQDFAFAVTNPGEYLVRTEDDLFVADAREKPVGLVRLFSRTLGQIEPVLSLSSGGAKYIVFNCREMHKGVLTESFSALRVRPGVPYDDRDYQQIVGFSSDDEGGGNGLDVGEFDPTVEAIDVDHDGVPELSFTVKCEDYRTRRKSDRTMTMKVVDGRFVEVAVGAKR